MNGRNETLCAYLSSSSALETVPWDGHSEGAPVAEAIFGYRSTAKPEPILHRLPCAWSPSDFRELEVIDAPKTRVYTTSAPALASEKVEALGYAREADHELEEAEMPPPGVLGLAWVVKVAAAALAMLLGVGCLPPPEPGVLDVSAFQRAPGLVADLPELAHRSVELEDALEGGAELCTIEVSSPWPDAKYAQPGGIPMKALSVGCDGVYHLWYSRSDTAETTSWDEAYVSNGIIGVASWIRERGEFEVMVQSVVFDDIGNYAVLQEDLIYPVTLY